MGFALYLSETGLPGILNQDKLARVQPEAGPLDAKQLPIAGALKPTRLADWDLRSARQSKTRKTRAWSSSTTRAAPTG